MPMKSKQPIALSREARWRNKVKSWPNMSSRRADSSSDSTSSEEEWEPGSSREASETPGVHPETWQEDDVKPNQEEPSEALNAGIRVPPKEDSATVVLNSKIAKTAACLSSDSLGKSSYDSMEGGLHDGPGVSGDTKNTGSEKPPQRRSFDCTVCGEKLYSVWKVQEHPDLGVGICRACYSFLFSSPYTKDKIDCSEEQCRWCGQGGRIVMCDDCDKAFCDSCIVRNYGPKELARIVSSNWSCFCCDPELLRVPIDELKEFQNSARQLSEHANNVAFKRKGASWAGQQTTRDANEDSMLGTEAGGATIAELLDEEEERRKQHKGMWTNSRRVKSTTHITSRKNKVVTSSFNPALHTKVCHGATTEVKQEPWVAIDQPPPASATTVVKQNHRQVATDKQSPASATTEVKKQHEMVIGKQAPAPATPATRTWIRPHQWQQKRKEAAERRKRTAEAELLKDVSDDGSKHTNSSMSEGLQHSAPCKDDACPKMPTGFAHDVSDAIVGNAGKEMKII